MYRLLKERNMYLKEAEDQQRKLDKFVADSAEDRDIKNAVCTPITDIFEYILTSGPSDAHDGGIQ
jgi:hypothetical protein